MSDIATSLTKEGFNCTLLSWPSFVEGTRNESKELQSFCLWGFDIIKTSDFKGHRRVQNETSVNTRQTVKNITKQVNACMVATVALLFVICEYVRCAISGSKMRQTDIIRSGLTKCFSLFGHVSDKLTNVIFTLQLNSTFKSKILRWMFGNCFLGILAASARSKQLSRWFAEHRPDILVLPECNHGYSHTDIVSVCRAFDTPIMVMPYTLCGKQEWLESISQDPAHEVRGILKKLLAKGFPEWVSTVHGKSYILPFQWIVPSIYQKCNPVLAWVTNSINGLNVAVDNKLTQKFYQNEGLDTNRWRIVGSLAEDMIYENLQNKSVLRELLSTKFGLSPDMPVIAIALPPNQFTRHAANVLEYTSYEDLLRFLIETVEKQAGNDYAVVINAHPRITQKDISMIKRLGGYFINAPIETLIPVASLFVAVASATIRWAIAAGVPTINLDAYNYKYRDYDDVDGVVTVATRKEFTVAIQSYVSDKSYRDDLSIKAEESSRKYFLLDGCSEKRITSAIQQLSKLNS